MSFLCILFWVLMVVGLCFGGYSGYAMPATDRAGFGGWLFFFVCLVLLGLKVCPLHD